MMMVVVVDHTVVRHVFDEMSERKKKKERVEIVYLDKLIVDGWIG